MLDTLLETLKKQRLVLSWALIVGLFLILVGHVPALPVLTGCLLAIGISVLRSRPQGPGKPASGGA